MPLLRYIGRRILFVVPQLFGIILVSFFLVKLIPGDPAVMMLGPTASQQSLDELRDKMGFTKPLLSQLVHYLHDVVRGDLGTSWQTTQPVTQDLFQRFPATLELISFGLLARDRHRLSARHCRGAAEARACAQIRRLLRAARRRDAGFLAGACTDLHILHEAQLEPAAARAHRHGGVAATDRHRQPGDRQPSGG